MKTKAFKRTRTGPITLSEIRKVFNAISPDQKTCEAYACKHLDRARFWNWFRMGVEFAQRQRISADDLEWVKINPRPLRK